MAGFCKNKCIYILDKGLCAFVVLGEDCKTYSGPQCLKPNEQTMLSTADCSRSCVEVYSILDCSKICDNFQGPRCTRKQHTIINHCDCTKRCVHILRIAGEGDECDAKGNSMCEKPLSAFKLR